MRQAPSWLPDRARAWIDNRRINRAVRRIDRTRPVEAAQPQQADAEVTMVVCKRDLWLALVAIKSLMRFKDVRFAATILDDGTLTPKDRDWLKRHVRGARWRTWKQDDADLHDRLTSRPHLGRYYRQSRYAPILKLVPPMVDARCDYVLLIDADTAFFRRPDRIFEAIGDDKSPPLYLHDHQDESRTVPPLAEQAFTELKDALLPDSAWGVRHRFFNSGLLAFRPGQLDLDLAEAYLGWRETAPAAYKSGKPGIWFGDWTPEQTCYHVMFAAADPPAEPLGDDYWLGGATDKVFNHFLRHYVVQKWVHNLLAKLVDEIE